MSSLALFHNFHFAIEMVGALTFGMVFWLSVDAFIATRSLRAVTKALGFGFLAAAHIIGSYDVAPDLLAYVGAALLITGLFFVVINLLQEAPVDRPEFRGLIVLPVFASVAPTIGVVAVAGYGMITLLSYLQFKKEHKRALLPFMLGFLALTLASAIGLSYASNEYGSAWIADHILRSIGYFAIVSWVWSYLALRIREELLLILISLSLFMAVAVSLSFSTILVNKFIDTTKQTITTDAKILELYLGQLVSDADTKTAAIASLKDIIATVKESDTNTLVEVVNDAAGSHALGFLLVADAEGEVLVRANMPVAAGDNVKNERAVLSALSGIPATFIETASRDGFSIRSAQPLVSMGNIIGVVVAGYQLDNAFADSLKSRTGLEFAIYRGKDRVASSEFAADGRTRATGIVETNPDVIKAVYEDKQQLTLMTNILSQSYIASYLPLVDTNGEVVGAISTGKSERTLIDALSATSRYTLAIAAIIMMVLIAPFYVVTRRLGKEMD